MRYQRILNLTNIESTVFLFGPRMTGKTSILKTLRHDRMINLLDRKLELNYRRNPENFWEEMDALPEKSLIIVDEIQKIPELLDYVQRAIDDKQHRFILSGSSARKLKRSGANLLGGRAIERQLYGLSHLEIDSTFSIKLAMQFGTLPKIYSLLESNQFDEAREILDSYCGLYIKDEIQAEALTRNIGAFQRFLNIAAQMHGHIIEYSNISDHSNVPASTVKEYFSILEDTLIGSFLWPWDASERKKARPKFYFFDPGVVRALQNRLNDPPTGQELGFLFEGWFVYEVKKINSLFRKRWLVSLWRDGDYELDLLVHDSKGRGFAVEIKSGNVKDIPEKNLQRLKLKFPNVQVIVASLSDSEPRRLESGTMVFPWKTALAKIQNF